MKLTLGYKLKSHQVGGFEYNEDEAFLAAKSIVKSQPSDSKRVTTSDSLWDQIEPSALLDIAIGLTEFLIDDQFTMSNVEGTKEQKARRVGGWGKSDDIFYRWTTTEGIDKKCVLHSTLIDALASDSMLKLCRKLEEPTLSYFIESLSKKTLPKAKTFIDYRISRKKKNAGRIVFETSGRCKYEDTFRHTAWMVRYCFRHFDYSSLAAPFTRYLIADFESSEWHEELPELRMPDLLAACRAFLDVAFEPSEQVIEELDGKNVMLIAKKLSKELCGKFDETHQSWSNNLPDDEHLVRRSRILYSLLVPVEIGNYFKELDSDIQELIESGLKYATPRIKPPDHDVKDEPYFREYVSALCLYACAMAKLNGEQLFDDDNKLFRQSVRNLWLLLAKCKHGCDLKAYSWCCGYLLDEICSYLYQKCATTHDPRAGQTGEPQVTLGSVPK